MKINFTRLEEISRALKTTDQTGRSFHTCFVYHGNKLLSISKNNYNKSHLEYKHGKYVSRKNNGHYNAARHAECASLVRIGKEDCTELTFVNIRVNNNGEPAKSKPCVNCERLLRSFNVKEVYYHDGSKYVREKYK